jgi:hypothetical protein
MQDLQRRGGGTVSLRVLDNDGLLVVERIEPADFLRVAYPVGTRLPYNHGAGGKVLLAFMDQEERKGLFRRKPLKKLTKKTIIDPKRLEAELGTIRKRGFALARVKQFPEELSELLRRSGILAELQQLPWQLPCRPPWFRAYLSRESVAQPCPLRSGFHRPLDIKTHPVNNGTLIRLRATQNLIVSPQIVGVRPRRI